jgi:predicted nucleic acid-binding Zn ribbon protein
MLKNHKIFGMPKNSGFSSMVKEDRKRKKGLIQFMLLTILSFIILFIVFTSSINFSSGYECTEAICKGVCERSPPGMCTGVTWNTLCYCNCGNLFGCTHCALGIFFCERATCHGYSCEENALYLQSASVYAPHCYPENSDRMIRNCTLTNINCVAQPDGFYGNCNGSCIGNFGDCNNDSIDGCERNLLIDHDNCGFCGNVCPKNQTCINGACGGLLSIEFFNFFNTNFI